MAEYVELNFADGTSVLLHAFPLIPSTAEPDGEEAGGTPWGGPPGLAGGLPVANGDSARKVVNLAHDALRYALRPLVPLLQDVHDTVKAIPDRPHEVSVEFGVRFGSDLKLAVVGAKGEASLTVTATWQLAPAHTDSGTPSAEQQRVLGRVAQSSPVD